MATAVPRTLPIKPKIDCPEVMDMPIAFIESDYESELAQEVSSRHERNRNAGLQAKDVLTIMIIAHTNRCSMKKV